MSEALAVPAVDLEEVDVPEQTEVRSNIKTKLLTAAAAGGISVGAYFVEKYGLVAGWPPPAHSFKHLAPGYWAASAASRVRRNKTAAIAGAGVAADFSVESAQDAVKRPDHYPFNWTHHAGEMDNIADFAVCMAGAALLLAQENHAVAWSRQRVRQLFARREIM